MAFNSVLLASFPTFNYLTSKCTNLCVLPSYFLNRLQTCVDHLSLHSLFNTNLDIISNSMHDWIKSDRSESLMSHSDMSKEISEVLLLMPAHRREIIPLLITDDFSYRLHIRFFSINHEIIVISFSLSAD